MRFLRDRFNRIVAKADDKTHMVLLTQTYYGCDCVDTQVRAQGTGHQFPPRCELHGNRWYAIRTDPIDEDDDA